MSNAIGVVAVKAARAELRRFVRSKRPTKNFEIWRARVSTLLARTFGQNSVECLTFLNFSFELPSHTSHYFKSRINPILKDLPLSGSPSYSDISNYFQQRLREVDEFLLACEVTLSGRGGDQTH